MTNLKDNSKLFWAPRLLQRFRRAEDGTAAIEFAILGVPFAALLFGIVEIAVVFLISTTTEHALAEVAREVRTGEFQTSNGGAPEFKAKVCAAMSGLGKCSKLRIDVIPSGTNKFSDIALPPSPIACTGTPAEIATCEAADPAMPADAYTTTTAEQVVVVRVQYVHKLAVPSKLTGLANASGNSRVITATTAFRNEPF